ncbi:bifunctional ADP-dependent NAD(P)H-hydrate dehydratase/NAD(P)H-hydrate epimerase [Psychromonas sp. psych-6C06]|uniref:NAD(P)H-hydrate dehydratase n=1 Tax=Psychromonas sp. psych-6C06 TaxID=2058089 RepID=UPI000C34A69D|nr:NAD(P)H-hydrate dehydratase [Psychromonas sp. psych-6C06]PKF61192.1 bifunctional ADP-dependent NAD(P)H-hydrate dehydratase/NAD(P)H-hydrate epimerase [Psychromonas sp. psych-6C06]
MLSEQLKVNASLPHSLYRAQQIKDFEGIAAEQAGTTLYGLMKRAGQACFQLFTSHFPEAKKVLVLTGSGNNGGDGYVFAAIAKDAGLHVQLCQVGDASELTGDAAQARNAWRIEQGVIDGIEQADFERCDVIVDALLGIGLLGTLRAEYQRLIHRINQSNKPVLSVDIPSGLNADTGYISDVAVNADATLCLVGLKQGLFTGRSAEYCGTLYFSGLGVENEFEQLCKNTVSRVTYSDVSGYLTPRTRTSHKGFFGKTLVIGGNVGMPGAARLASEAALRCGSGLVKVLTVPENLHTILSGRPELMGEGIGLNKLTNNILQNWATVLTIGPGLGSDQWAQTLLDYVLESELPVVVDADALNLLVDKPAWKENWMLTPHPGEAATLLGCSISKIEEDRFSAVRNLQRSFGGVVILKGAGTLICDGKQVYVANVGNPGMASGGMGDVLSGIIAGLLAQGLDSLQASILGVSIHGLAADAAAETDERGLLASDLFPYIRKLVNP